MFPSVILPSLPAHPAMLLVLLPTVGSGPGQESAPARTATNLLLNGLQVQLGAAIRILKVDETSNPAVVQAFDSQGVPAFVLLRDGAELWRQQGLPEGEPMAALLLSKLLPLGKSKQVGWVVWPRGPPNAALDTRAAQPQNGQLPSTQNRVSLNPRCGPLGKRQRAGNDGSSTSISSGE
jgi:hypothetical protein